MIVAICGLPGSGKSEVRKFFEKKGFVYIHLGVVDLIMKKYGYTSEKLERPLREKMRKERGMGVMIEIALPRIRKIIKSGKNVVIDNLYSWDEYKILKEKFPKEFFTIAVHASPKIRYDRLKERKFRALDEKSAMARDYSHVENLDVGGPIVMADFNVVNEEDIRSLRKELLEVWKKIA